MHLMGSMSRLLQPQTEAAAPPPASPTLQPDPKTSPAPVAPYLELHAVAVAQSALPPAAVLTAAIACVCEACGG